RRGPSTTGPWTTIRQVVYSYDGSGNPKKAQIEDAAGNVLDTRYARYWASSQSGGYTNGLKYYFCPPRYAPLAAYAASQNTTVDNLTDAQVAPYADYAFQFDGVQRATQATVQGAGCPSCAGGLGTYTYSYTTSAFPDGVNNWRRKNVETLPDGNQ